MKAIMVMFDSLNRNMLNPYGGNLAATPNFNRLAEHSVTFDNCYAGSLPCMPARRELHTGRYNFLHRSWGPLEPFDDSMPELLNHSGIHSHIVTDHNHYFEDGGATYHTRYRTWEGFRGQEGDAWKGVVSPDQIPEGYRNRCDGVADNWEHNWVPQDFVNRSYMETEEKQPQSLTFEAGCSFIRTNHGADQWYLQIETFDPHEPFFSQEKFKKLFPDPYNGGVYDWPDYRKVDERDTPEEILHLRAEYAALLTMCQTMLSPEATQIGSYRGLTLELAFDTFAREYRLTMIGQLRHTVTLGTDVFGNLQRMDNALEGLPIKEQTCREQLSNLQTQLETAKAEVQKPFPREAELNTKTARLEELNSLLNLDHKEPEIVDAEPDEDQRPPERRRPQLER